MLRRSKKAQSTAEYAIVIGLVIAAVVGMQVYVKRGIQAKVKDASDTKVDIAGIANNDDGDFGVNSGSGQYEPGYANTTDMRTERNSTDTTSVAVGGGVTRALGNEVITRNGQTDILAP
jgi:hypothetical protein